ncbi:MAG: branched-chain amino acid ABC transporter permease [Alphaproteobacteria bacterium]
MTRPSRILAWGRRCGPPALLLAVLTACGVDSEQAQLCRMLVPAFEGDSATADILRQVADPAAENAVLIEYQVPDAGGEPGRHWISCRFAGGALDVDRLALIGVATDRRGELSEIRLHLLRQWLGLFDTFRVAAGEDRAGGPRSALGSLLYLAQMSANAVVISCVYGLLAIGYTLVYGIVGRINLAFGEMAMVGGFATFIGVSILALSTGVALPLALLLVLVFAMATSAVHGWATERLVFRPMRGVSGQAPLIATIGLAVFLQEYVRLVQGSRDRWLQPILTDRLQIGAEAGFSASVSVGQVLVLALTAALYVTLLQVLKRTGLGRAQRACADDTGMAALLGVDVDRTIAWTFVLGAGYAAAAGFIIATYYGGVNIFMGHVIGFKALAAAIVGGIGSVAGAMLGGVLIGVIEIFWSGYLSIAYKDIAIFTLLTLVLIFRPEGLMGRRSERGD